MCGGCSITLREYLHRYVVVVEKLANLVVPIPDNFEPIAAVEAECAGILHPHSKPQGCGTAVTRGLITRIEELLGHPFTVGLRVHVELAQFDAGVRTGEKRLDLLVIAGESVEQSKAKDAPGPDRDEQVVVVIGGVFFEVFFREHLGKMRCDVLGRVVRRAGEGKGQLCQFSQRFGIALGSASNYNIHALSLKEEGLTWRRAPPS